MLGTAAVVTWKIDFQDTFTMTLACRRNVLIIMIVYCGRLVLVTSYWKWCELFTLWGSPECSDIPISWIPITHLFYWLLNIPIDPAPFAAVRTFSLLLLHIMISALISIERLPFTSSEKHLFHLCHAHHLKPTCFCIVIDCYCYRSSALWFVMERKR